MDVKVLILYVMARVAYPVDANKIYELCLQDDCLSYFDIMEAIPQMVQTGHLEKDGEGNYTITQKGRDDGSVIEDSLAYPVAQRAKAAVERFNRAARRDDMVHMSIVERKTGDFSVILGLDDEVSNLFTLELMAPTREQAKKLADAFHDHAEEIYKLLMNELLRTAEKQPGNEWLTST